jgi:hypothetical protein
VSAGIPRESAKTPARQIRRPIHRDVASPFLVPFVARRRQQIKRIVDRPAEGTKIPPVIRSSRQPAAFGEVARRLGRLSPENPAQRAAAVPADGVFVFA